MEENKIIDDENPKDGVRQEIVPAMPTKGECPEVNDLSEKEQKSPIAWKWVMNEINRLRVYEHEYNQLKDQYTEIDKAFAVHKASASTSLAIDVTTSLMLAIGPAMIGLTPSVGSSNEDDYTKLIICGIGIILLIASIILKSLAHFKKI